MSKTHTTHTHTQTHNNIERSVSRCKREQMYIFSLSYINTHTHTHNSHRFYFTIVTLTTVGYGDMGATTDGTRLFTTFFVLFGIGFIGVALGIVASKFLDWEENAAKALAKIADDVHDTVKIEMDTMVDQSVKFLARVFLRYHESLTGKSGIETYFAHFLSISGFDMISQNVSDELGRVGSITQISRNALVR